MQKELDTVLFILLDSKPRLNIQKENYGAVLFRNRAVILDSAIERFYFSTREETTILHRFTQRFVRSWALQPELGGE